MTDIHGQIISNEMITLSQYMANAEDLLLPDEVIEIAKHHILDTIAAMISGSRLGPGLMALRHVRAMMAAPEASLAGCDHLTSAPFAAMANGMCAHADETDDSHYTSRTHPGASIVPAALALAHRNSSSGLSFLRAVVLGYDIGTRLVHALDMRGFAKLSRSCHSFGGTFGAGASVGLLQKFNAEQMRYLLSYCAQMASGCGAYMHDASHIEKAYVYAGKSAQNGVQAGLMVADGFPGAPDVFSGDRNFLDAYAAVPDRAALIDALGRRFEITRTNLKKWCVGSPIQAPLDALESIMEQVPTRLEDIESIEVELAPTNARTVDGRPIPNVNLQHLFGVMLVDRKLTFESSHDPARMMDEHVIQYRDKIHILPSPALEFASPPRQSIVTLRLSNKTYIRRHILAVRGTADNPMTRTEVITKAEDLMVPVLGKIEAQKIIDGVFNIERAAYVRGLNLGTV